MKFINMIMVLLTAINLSAAAITEKGNKTMIYELGDKRELFIDNFFIKSLEGDVRKKLHNPVPDEIVMTLDEPHEMSNRTASSYTSIIFDGSRYLIYYRAARDTYEGGKLVEKYILCVAETVDGINFKRSQVNLSPEGYNVVLDNSMTDHLVEAGAANVMPGVTTAFYDTNPACPADERYKLIATNEKKEHGMYLFVSGDGFKFKQKNGRFDLAPDSGYDSANQAFFDHSIGKYRLYHRGFRNDGPTWKRTIMGHITEDFVKFTPIGKLEFDEKFDKLFAEGNELYTNAIRPYYRAPHIFIGLPMRYFDGSMIPGMHLPSPYKEGTPHEDPESEWNVRILARPAFNERKELIKYRQMRHAMASTDTVLISSRDGKNFIGIGESFLKPPPQNDSWFYGSGTLFIGMIPTRSKFGKGAPDELSFYAGEGEWGKENIRIRRYHIRQDGFVSLNFGIEGGTFVSPKFTFKGGRLSLNISTGAFGGFTAELRDENNNPIPGYTFEESLPEIGDDLAMIARWKKHGSDLRSLEGKTVQLAIKARNADIYSIAFLPYEPDPEFPSYFELRPDKKVEK